jgi:quinoprotein relay system zinc metallohydrolase 1
MKILIFLTTFISILLSADFDYKLKPIKLSDNSYYFYGKEEYFSKQNGGDIANSSFIITKDSVILIDTGSSKLYGEQVKKQIELITNKPIKYILNTHHHPDHFLGNIAFSNSNIYASEYTKNEIETNGDLYIMNLVNIVNDAMNDTKVKAPSQILTSKTLDLDGYKLKILYFDGHTQSDIAIYDENTKILYASDLVFYKRTPATPHANINKWIKSLKELENIPYTILVPGHGITSKTKEPIKENILYLEYLEKILSISAKEGLDIYEILNKPIPIEFKDFTMFKEEFERSVINLYPQYEKDLK